MTQAQFAQWLGVSIKQVKYLEHQRRNPSGPTRRLLGILANQLNFEGVMAIQVLGASPTPTTPPARHPKAGKPPIKKDSAQGVQELSPTAPKTEVSELNADTPAPPPDDEAFVWV